MRALVPAALLALFGGWCGTFYYGASASGVALGHLALLAAAAWGWRGWDPLRLGPRGKALPPLLWMWLLVSLRASPVPRAGWLAAALLPAFLALPAVVARCWDQPALRRRGGLAVSCVAGGAAAVALAGMAWQGSSRAAQPLGSAPLLGACLAILVPLALVVAAGERGNPWRAATIGLVVLAAAALLATRSVAAAAGATIGTAFVLPRGSRRWLVVPLLGGVLVLGTRLAGLTTGGDPSLQARWTYWQAGARGLLARPLLGWGPGSTAWTVAPLLRPRPGVNPPGEVVGDLHSVPLQLAYELGIPGFALASVLLVAFVRARAGETDLTPGDGPGLRRGGLAGLAAGATALLAGPTLATTAVWVALAVAAGAALLGKPGSEVPAKTASPGPSASPPSRRSARAPALGWLTAAVALLLVAPLDAALGFYEAARRTRGPRAPELVELAAALDPGMPLYQARLGWLAPTAGARAVALRKAALAAPGVPALQLAAGWAAQSAGLGGADELARACNADPLSGPAPFLLAFAAPRSPSAARLGARALLADPPLLAATAWEREPALLAAALAAAEGWNGVDTGLREALVDGARALPRRGRPALLRVTVDEEPSTAVSLHLFRRRPWPATLAAVPVRREAFGRAERIPAAGALATTSEDAFGTPCVSGPSRPR